MRFKNILKAFFIVLIILFIILISYFIYSKYFTINTDTITPTTQETDQSVFKKINLKKYEGNTLELMKVLSTPDYWDNWDWQTKMIETEIYKVEPETGEFLLRPSRPANQSFSTSILRVKATCPPEDTIKVSSVNPTTSLSEGGFNILSQAESKDILYAYCLDQDCLNIGERCILVKWINPK